MSKNKKYPRPKDVADTVSPSVEEPIMPSEEQKEEVMVVKGYVDGVDSCLNIRKAPLVNEYNIIAIVGKGAELSVVDPANPVEENGELWYKVIVDENRGYAMKKYIKIVE